MRETFEEALQANWDDLATHRAFADWLTDQGDPRGELARCQILLETAATTPQQQHELRTREQALLAQYQTVWLGNLIPKPPPRHWSADMACRVEFRWQRGWVVGLRCPRLEIAHARNLAASPELRFLRELEIVADSWSGTLRKTDRLPGFPFKQFQNPKHTRPFCIYPLATSAHFGNVRKLVVGQPVDLAAPHNPDPPENTCFADALLALASRLPRLEHLSIAQIHYYSELVELFSHAGPLSALRELELYYLPASDVSRLLQCPSLNGVRRLTLHASMMAHRDAANTTFYNLRLGVEAPYLSSLESLRVYREARGDVLLDELADSPVFGRLRELAFVCSRVTNAGAETLLAARPRSALTALDLSFGIFSPSVLQRLRDAYPFLVANGVMTPEQQQQQEQQAAAAQQQMMAEVDWE